MHHLNLKTQLKKNSVPLNDTFDFIPFHLTFQGDVSAPNKNKAILVFVTKKDFEINGHELMQVFVTKPTVK